MDGDVVMPDDATLGEHIDLSGMLLYDHHLRLDELKVDHRLSAIRSLGQHPSLRLS